MNFTHLRLHSEYALSDGMVRIKPLVELCKSYGYSSVAVTDINNVFGLIKFYKACEKAQIKPILGAEINVRDDKGIHRLVLLCKNNQGYVHLCELVSKVYLQGQTDIIPALDEAMLAEHSDGLIALSAGQDGAIGKLLENNQLQDATDKLAFYQSVFTEFYLEVSRINRKNEAPFIENTLKLAEQTQTPALATNFVCFADEEEFLPHEARVCINRGWQLADPNRERNYTTEQYFKTPEAMQTLFSDYPELLENAQRVAQKCNVKLDIGNNYLPAFDNDEGLTEADYLVKLAKQGLEDRLIQLFKTPEEITKQRAPFDERLAIELDVINQMGFPGYFLIVADFIQWAKEQDIPVGPGRGSGAGSLVAFSLKITDLDPLEYDLLFERFLNPERVSMPDFDIDFCMDRRDEVIDYVASKYGRDKVSQIATHGTMAAKAVVRDVGRVLGNGYGFVDGIAKLIPFEIGMTLSKALEQEDDLRSRYEQEEEVKTLIDLALSLEGLARNVGKHAGGVVIAPSKLTDFSALYCEKDGKGLVVQYDKDDIEAAGLVKFDFLGLRTLTIIDWAVKNVNQQRHADGKTQLNINDIPLDDKKTFNLLKACQTTAVFQLESSGMKDLIKRLQPDNFEDIIALVALFRPGPLQSGMVDDFINRKHGRAKVAYPDENFQHTSLKPILEPTYGVIVYQEQVMQIAQELAGYTLGGADMLRRAMGKKKPEEMAKQREVFEEGAIKQQVDGQLAIKIFDLVEKFAGYGFNKSHSAAYALLAYQTAWLKAHHPEAFMAAVLSADMDNTDKVVTLIEECRSMGLKVKNPDINTSIFKFSVNENNEIVYGLGAIKGAGESALSSILEDREKQGKFTSLEAFFTQCDLKKVNKRVMEALIKAGAFDNIEPNRRYIFEHLESLFKLAEQTTKNKQSGQTDMFGMSIVSTNQSTQNSIGGSSKNHPAWDANEQLQYEKASLGLYLTGHPIDSYKKELDAMIGSSLAATLAGFESFSKREQRGKPVFVAGLIIAIRIKQGQKGKMAFVTIDDRSGRTELRFFAKSFEKNQHLLIQDSVIIVRGKCVYDDFADAFRINADTVYNLAETREQCANAIQISANETTANQLLPILNASVDNTGCQIFIDLIKPYQNGQLIKGKIKLPDECRLPLNTERYHQLIDTFGNDNIQVKYDITKLAEDNQLTGNFSTNN